MHEEPTPLPTPLNQLSDAQLHALADAVEAQNPWSGFGYHAICTTRRFMVTIWALVIFPYVSPNLWIAAILCSMALVFDLLVSSKSPDIMITERDTVFDFAEHWDNPSSKIEYILFDLISLIIPSVLFGGVIYIISYGCGLYLISPNTAYWVLICSSILGIALMSRFYLQIIAFKRVVFQDVKDYNLRIKRMGNSRLFNIIVATPVAIIAILIYFVLLFKFSYITIFKFMLFRSTIILLVIVWVLFTVFMYTYVLLDFRNFCANIHTISSIESNYIFYGAIGVCFSALLLTWFINQHYKHFSVANAILKHYGVHFSQTSQSTT